MLLASALGGFLSAQGMVIGVHPLMQVLSTGDADGDGRNDVVRVAAVTPPAFEVIGSRTGLPVPYLARLVPSAEWYYRFLGDVDADGHDDLAYYANFRAPIEIVSGANGSTLMTLPSGAVIGATDYDADGHLDIVHLQSGAASVLEIVRSGRDGSTLFVLQVSPTSTVQDRIVLVGDANGDGYEDLGLSTVAYGVPWTSLRVQLGPDGTTTMPIGANGVAVGDVDADGRIDFGRIDLARSRPGEIVDVNGQLLWALGSSNAEARPLGDLDGDGHDDVAIVDATPADVRSGATRAQFPGAQPSAMPTPLGDIDGDGRDECGFWPTFVYEWQDPASPVASRITRRGVPGTTSTGRKPRIKTRGHCGLGHSVFFDLRGAMPNGVTFLAFGGSADVDLAPLGAPGNRAYVAPQGWLTIATDGRGLARHQATIPNSSALLAAQLTVQCASFDPPANALGVATSDAVDLEVH